MNTIWHQIVKHAVAIISLVVALIALTYTTWREEETERNRNLRTAAFEVLKNLGELQLIVNTAHFTSKSTDDNSIMGWGRVALIGDLAQLLPKPIPEASEKLVQTWQANANQLEQQSSVDQVSDTIDSTRAAVIKVLRELR